jgi:hypothetical protein
MTPREEQFFFLGLALGMDGRPPESWLIPLLGEIAHRHPMSSLEPIREEISTACQAARLKLSGMLS